MPSSESLSLQQNIGLRMSQQQLRFVKLLELNASELDEAVARELQENPALAADSTEIQDEQIVPSSPTSSNSDYQFYRQLRQPGGMRDDMHEFTAPDTDESLYDYLLRQLSERHLSPRVEQAAEYFIGSLDSNGYLRRSLPQLIDDLAFGPGINITEDEASEALKTLRSLEPYGIGAVNLQDCLSLQLRNMPRSQTVEDAEKIIDTQFEAFSMKHTHRIISGLGIGAERVKKAINLILSLNPKPGAGVGNADPSNVIVPDVIVDVDDDDHISLRLNNRIPELSLDTSFEEAYRALNPKGKKRRNKASDFIATRLNDARDFIKILNQRQQTLMQVVTAIVAIQKEYFLTHDVYTLRPMMIKDIAAKTGLDISVISRSTAGKYLAAPWGTFPLRFFFSDTIGDQQGAQTLTNRKVEAEISRLVAAEDKKHPLSDEKIKIEMANRGFELSRRTVAKYRDRLGIPVARLRKNL